MKGWRQGWRQSCPQSRSKLFLGNAVCEPGLQEMGPGPPEALLGQGLIGYGAGVEVWTWARAPRAVGLGLNFSATSIIAGSAV